MAVFHWTCPFCDRDTTIDPDHSTCRGVLTLDIDNADGLRDAETLFIVCPNPKCRKYTFTVSMYKAERRTFNKRDDAFPERLVTYQKVVRSNAPFAIIWGRRLEPPSRAKVFPKYIPEVITNDYTEACAILEDSPKASATLARRCLQGMIRDFWGIKRPEGFKGFWALNNEINALKDRVDTDVWNAMDGLRKVGNIGAHMEQDVNVIVDVEPDEARALIRLIETLVREWYVNREQRKEALRRVAELGASKDAAKKEGMAVTAAPVAAAAPALAGAPAAPAPEKSSG